MAEKQGSVGTYSSHSNWAISNQLSSILDSHLSQKGGRAASTHFVKVCRVQTEGLYICTPPPLISRTVCDEGLSGYKNKRLLDVWSRAANGSSTTGCISRWSCVFKLCFFMENWKWELKWERVGESYKWIALIIQSLLHLSISVFGP